MSQEATAYPLSWPAHRPRTPAGERKPGAFRSGGSGADRRRAPKLITIVDARWRLTREVELIQAKFPVLSTNVELRLDGQPYAGRPESSDPGVALYFQIAGKPLVLACDQYHTVAANMAAIAAHLDATRIIERHGVGTLEQLFAGFLALPAPAASAWRTVLGFPISTVVTREMIQVKRRELARQHHSDLGGNQDSMAEINAAADAGLKELKVG